MAYLIENNLSFETSALLLLLTELQYYYCLFHYMFVLLL